MNTYVRRLIDECGGDYGGRWWLVNKEEDMEKFNKEYMLFTGKGRIKSITLYITPDLFGFLPLYKEEIEFFRQRCILYLLEMVEARAIRTEQVFSDLQRAMEEVLYEDSN